MNSKKLKQEQSEVAPLVAENKNNVTSFHTGEIVSVTRIEPSDACLDIVELSLIQKI